MERELEKTLMEIEHMIKVHEQRENTHTQSVLEQAQEIVEMCAQAARTPSDLKEILRTHAGWISVEERLPEESLNSVIGWDEYREKCCFVQYYGGKWILGNREPVNIIAWRPLPDPYRPEEERWRMRLIDADRLMDALRGNVLIDVTPELEKAIEQQPTAFDKEKVIEELRSEATRWHESGVEFKDENEKGVAGGFRLATHIVEKGGIE